MPFEIRNPFDSGFKKKNLNEKPPKVEVPRRKVSEETSQAVDEVMDEDLKIKKAETGEEKEAETGIDPRVEAEVKKEVSELGGVFSKLSGKARGAAAIALFGTTLSFGAGAFSEAEAGGRSSQRFSNQPSHHRGGNILENTGRLVAAVGVLAGFSAVIDYLNIPRHMQQKFDQIRAKYDYDRDIARKNYLSVNNNPRFTEAQKADAKDAYDRANEVIDDAEMAELRRTGLIK